MERRQWLRFLTLGILVVGLLGVCIGFGALEPNPSEGRYPDVAMVGEHPDQVLHQDVMVTGTVVNTAPGRLTVPYTTVSNGDVLDRTITITLRDLPQSIREGDRVQVFGTLTDDRTVRVTRMVTVPSRNIGYMYAISFLAGLWTLSRIVRHWRFDRAQQALIPRTSPLRLRDRLNHVRNGREMEDRDA